MVVDNGQPRSYQLPRRVSTDKRPCRMLLTALATFRAVVGSSEATTQTAENLHNNLSVGKLADRTAMSVRNFERVFMRELGKTPTMFCKCEQKRRAGIWRERTKASNKLLPPADSAVPI
jgi:AraC-like DNA-binding protein